MGRPRAFEPDEVLDKAVEIFWERGYAATSMQDLQSAMGINAFSIYSTWGDKQGLFLAAIDRYVDNTFDRVVGPLVDETKGLQGLLDHFHNLVEALKENNVCIGCLIQNTAIERTCHDAAAEARVRRFYERLSAAMRGALERAYEKGEVKTSGAELDRLAAFLIAFGQGLIVMAKSTRDWSLVGDAVRSLERQMARW